MRYQGRIGTSAFQLLAVRSESGLSKIFGTMILSLACKRNVLDFGGLVDTAICLAKQSLWRGSAWNSNTCRTLSP